MNIGARIYRARRIFKYVFPTLIVLITCIFLSGPISFFFLLGLNTRSFYKMIGYNTTNLLDINNQTWGKDEPYTYMEIVSIIGGNVKVVMCSGLALFFTIIGVMGLYFWTRTDYKKYDKLWIVGVAFLMTAALGLQALWNYAYS